MNCVRSFSAVITRIACWLGVMTVTMVLENQAVAQLGPVRANGYLEYQYRLTDTEGRPGTSSHLGTWRVDADTYLWAPYILQLDGFLVLSRTNTSSTQQERRIDQISNLTTGGLRANLFQQSHFPFRAYVERRDSRIDDELIDFGVTTSTFGFLQQYAPRGGGRYSIDYRNSTDDRLQEDGFRMAREFEDERLQINLSRGFNQNELRLNSLFGETKRLDQDQARRLITHNLRHRFRTSPRFYLENSAFYSTEDFDLQGFESNRRFLQINGNAVWRPRTERPLLVTTRALIQGTDSGMADSMQSAGNTLLTSIATYQMSDHLTVSGNLGVGHTDAPGGLGGSTSFQLVRSSYRSDDYPLWNSNYQWIATAEAANRTGPDSEVRTGDTRNVTGKFDHSLSRVFAMTGGLQAQWSLSQRLTSAFDSREGPWQMLDHSAYLTLGSQKAQSSSYVRLSLTDRRQFNFNEGVFQLVNLQASRMTQATRYRSWTGSVTLQYTHNTRDNEIFADTRRDSFNYSIDLRYRHINLFDVENLNFTSELRLLSTNFMTNDPLDADFERDSERRDTMWRNRVSYRIGKLELDLRADAREIQDKLAGQVFLRIRRYYGET